MINKKLNILIINIHGLIRSSNLELGRDADTGGQTKYVYEYAKELGLQPEVGEVYILTRKFQDKRYSPDYSVDYDSICENVQILRVKCDGSQYIKKEKLWPFLDEFVDHTLETLITHKIKIDLIHSHYADAGYVAIELSKFLNVPFIHTGHSLGIPKKKKLEENNVDENAMEIDYKISHRIAVEEKIIQRAKLIVTSTQQEIDKQYSLYNSSDKGIYEVIPPGIDLYKFYPYFYLKDRNFRYLRPYELSLEMRESIRKELRRFLVEPNKPLILTICRPERRKNIEGLIQAYGLDKELQSMANLAIFAGIRKDISKKNRLEQKILMDMLLMMDKYDLYGKLAIPKKHDSEYQIPELYRFTAQLGGVFINPAFIEPFGLTLLEAAASGLPMIATNNGGPQDIIKNCQNGILVDASDPEDISKALKKIISDQETWSKYSNNGINNVKQHYSWEPHCKHLLKTIKEKNILKTKPISVETTNSIRDNLSSFEKIIITDIDNTLIGDTQELNKFLDWYKKNNKEFGFGVATGRNIESALDILKKNKVPMPDILVTSVGTEINYQFANTLFPDKRWPSILKEKWNFLKIKELLTEFEFLTLQEDLREFKISYFVENCTKDKISLISSKLKQNNVKYKLILTENKLLDILPHKASKYKAILHLINKWKLSEKKILVCGDAGNDREMLREMQNAVVVANHQKELRSLKSAYFSKEKYAGAILDGLNHFGFV
jgi:sucrose-phosphate synthase